MGLASRVSQTRFSVFNLLLAALAGPLMLALTVGAHCVGCHPLSAPTERCLSSTVSAHCVGCHSLSAPTECWLSLSALTVLAVTHCRRSLSVGCHCRRSLCVGAHCQCSHSVLALTHCQLALTADSRRWLSLSGGSQVSSFQVQRH